MNNKSFIIKVCGMRNEENIRAVESLGIDWMGFIFYPSSKRYVDVQPNYLPEKTRRVGVFVNESLATIVDKVALFSLDMVQLHGNESPELCQQLQDRQVKVMKAFGIDDYFPSEKIAAFEGCCDYFLFDTHTSAYGGSGRKFDWDILQRYEGNTPFLLSGGIGSDDVSVIRKFSHPLCVGIDINSQFELSPANKDIQSIQQFINSLKQ
ncbi:MAG TPA: phosphoribosylanthranilate isomerase [Dysgonamonadaceae bacterium]|nr:phosphoribosylanthranilate isomerase [Dysgonamonadaceae bacterium]